MEDRKSSPFEPYRPAVITEIYEREVPDPSFTAKEMKEHLLFEALFDLFYTPIDLESLKEDLFVAEDPEEVHHDSMYYLCQARLKDYSNYTHKRSLPSVDIKRQLNNICSQFATRISKLEESIAKLEEQTDKKLIHQDKTESTGKSDLTEEIDSLNRKVSALGLICKDLSDNIQNLTKSLNKSDGTSE